MAQSIQINRGDTLSKIANSYGTTVQGLLRLNPQIKDANKIYAGQALVVPPKPASATQNQGGSYIYNGKSYAMGTGPQQSSGYTPPQSNQNQQSTYDNPGPGVGLNTYTPPADQQNPSYTPPPPQQTPAYTPPPAETTGNTQLDELYAEMKAYLKKIQDSGQIVNPNIALSPSEIQGFLDQAEGQISPYYQSQFATVKNDLKSNLEYLQKNYDIEQENAKAEFTKSLGTARESAAGAGTVFSGGRARGEQDLASTQNRALEQYGLTTQEKARSLVTGAEGKIGSGNLQEITLPQFGMNTASTSGRGGFTPSRTLSYGGTGGVTGSLEYEKRKEARDLGDYLAQQESKRRSLNPLLYPQ